MIASRRSFHFGAALGVVDGRAGHRARRYSPSVGISGPAIPAGASRRTRRRPSAASSVSSSSSSNARESVRELVVVGERGRAHDRAAGAHRERRRRRDRGGDVHGGVERGAGFDESADEPELVRARGVDGLAGEDRVHRRRRDRSRVGAGRVRPAAATRLWRTSARPNDERVVATTTSAASTISIPPAVASPSTATTIGFSRSRYTNPPNPPRSVSSVAAVPVSRMTLRSAPAQNTGRVWPSTFAVSTPTRSVGVVLEPIDRRLQREGELAIDRVAGLGPVEGDDADVVGRSRTGRGSRPQM